MSQENVEIVHRGAEALNHGDETAALALFDEAIVFEPQRASIEGAYHGLGGIREFLRDTKENWAEFKVTYTDVRQVGERVLAIGMVRTRGRGSGVETEMTTAALFTFRDGRIVHYKDFGDRRAALEAAGLSK